MTFNEMIISLRMYHTVGGAVYCDVSPEMGEQIIAALRAGQAMRDSLGWMGSDDSLDDPDCASLQQQVRHWQQKYSQMQINYGKVVEAANSLLKKPVLLGMYRKDLADALAALEKETE